MSGVKLREIDAALYASDAGAGLLEEIAADNGPFAELARDMAAAMRDATEGMSRSVVASAADLAVEHPHYVGVVGDDPPPKATDVQLVLCGCPHVHIILTDDEGVLAQIALEPVDFQCMAVNILSAIEGLRGDPSDTIGDTEGTA